MHNDINSWLCEQQNSLIDSTVDASEPLIETSDIGHNGEKDKTANSDQTNESPLHDIQAWKVDQCWSKVQKLF